MNNFDHHDLATKIRTVILVSFILSISTFFGCKSQVLGVAEISLSKHTYKIREDSVTIFYYDNSYSDTNYIWAKVINSLKPNAPCNIPMMMFDTVVRVRATDSTEISFKYTRWDDELGVGWAQNGLKTGPKIDGFVCYSIDDSLYSQMISQIRESAKFHKATLTNSQTLPAYMFPDFESLP